MTSRRTIYTSSPRRTDVHVVDVRRDNPDWCGGAVRRQQAAIAAAHDDLADATEGPLLPPKVHCCPYMPRLASSGCGNTHVEAGAAGARCCCCYSSCVRATMDGRRSDVMRVSEWIGVVGTPPYFTPAVCLDTLYTLNNIFKGSDVLNGSHTGHVWACGHHHRRPRAAASNNRVSTSYFYTYSKTSTTVHDTHDLSYELLNFWRKVML